MSVSVPVARSRLTSTREADLNRAQPCRTSLSRAHPRASDVRRGTLAPVPVRLSRVSWHYCYGIFVCGPAWLRNST